MRNTITRLRGKRQLSRLDAQQRGYGAEWQSVAKAYRVQHPYCVGCAAIGRREPATCVDHIIPHRGDQLLFWDKNNWQSSCAWHHNAIKQQLEGMYETKTINVQDMRLDSPKAVALSRTTPRKLPIGLDGWPE